MLENPWSAVGNPTSALRPSGSSFGPSSLAPVGIHLLLLSTLTTEHTQRFIKVSTSHFTYLLRFCEQTDHTEHFCFILRTRKIVLLISNWK